MVATRDDESLLRAHAAQLADLVFQLLADCHEKENRIAARHNLSPAEFRCLRAFRGLESVSNKDIAQKMNLTPGRLSRILDGLAAKNYVIRKEDSHDRRNVVVSLSSKGKNLVTSLEEDYLNAHADILRRLNMPHENLVQGMGEFLTAVRDWLEK